MCERERENDFTSCPQPDSGCLDGTFNSYLKCSLRRHVTRRHYHHKWRAIRPTTSTTVNQTKTTISCSICLMASSQPKHAYVQAHLYPRRYSCSYTSKVRQSKCPKPKVPRWEQARLAKPHPPKQVANPKSQQLKRQSARHSLAGYPLSQGNRAQYLNDTA